MICCTCREYKRGQSDAEDKRGRPNEMSTHFECFALFQGCNQRLFLMLISLSNIFSIIGLVVQSIKCHTMVKNVNQCFPKRRPQMSWFVHDSKIISSMSCHRGVNKLLGSWNQRIFTFFFNKKLLKPINRSNQLQINLIVEKRIDLNFSPGVHIFSLSLSY